MIAALDSSAEPTAAQALAARAAGVHLWSGYLATRANVGLAHAWSRQGFEAARLCGGTPLAFCSGWDDPAALRALATEWNVRLCLDVESLIRDDGPWVDGFLATSGAGLYGFPYTHYHAAPFHIMADYLGYDPSATWGGKTSPPSGPHGWQWQGTHDEFGIGVDSSWLDDWFATGSDPIFGGQDMGMGPTLRPDGSGFDYVIVAPDHVVHHLWYDEAHPELGLQREDLGGWAHPLSTGCAWEANMSVFHATCLGEDGNLWQLNWDRASGKWSGWYRLTSSGQPITCAVPAAAVPGPKGDPGPAGPAGPAGTVPPHSHALLGNTSVAGGS